MGFLAVVIKMACFYHFRDCKLLLCPTKAT